MRLSASHAVKQLSALVALLLMSGCGPAWKVIRASGPPSALAGASEVAVAFDYSKMVVEGRTEAAWVAEKTAEDAKYESTWADLKGRFEAAVLEGVRANFPKAQLAKGGESLVMQIQPEIFKMGKFIPYVLPPTKIDARIVFLSGGNATDEIQLMRSYSPSLVQPSVFNHIGPVGQAIGRAGGSLLASKK
jgi:hypothetical protein